MCYGLAIELQVSMAEVLYEKDDAVGQRRVDAAAPDGRCPRWYFCRSRLRAHGMVWLRLRPVLPPVSVRSLLRRAERRPGETGHEGEGRPSIRRRRLCGDLRETQDHVDAPRHLHHCTAGSGTRAILGKDLR